MMSKLMVILKAIHPSFSKRLGFTFFLLAVSLVSFGKIPPSEWSHSNPDKAAVGDVIEVVFTTDIPEGFHIYGSVDECNGLGPIMSELVMNDHRSYELVGPLKEVGIHKVFDDIFNCNVGQFDEKAKFIQKIRILKANPIIEGSLDYQMCNEGSCVLHKYPFTVSVDVETASGSSPPKNDPVKKTPNNGGSVGADRDEGAEEVVLDSEILEQLLECCEGKDKEEVLPQKRTLAAGDVNYSTYQASGESDTTTCQIKKFDGKTGKEKQTYWGLFVVAFISGLLALLTPCVFPMIPMTVSFFMKEGNKSKAIRTGLIYGISIIAIYVVIGTLVALLFGATAANWLSTHWFPNILFFLIFVIFAASFFGAFELTLPSWMVNKVDKQADKGGLIGVFFMAFTIVLVSFSCTGPIVGAILVQSAGGEVIRPIVGMLGFSLAFAIPFTLFAIFPSWLNNLPQSGGWLNTVKVVLGFIELALGLKFLSVADQTYHWGILDREIYIGLWIVIFFLMGIYLMGKIKFAHDSDVPFLKVPRLFMVIITFAFVVYLIPGLWGAPLKFLSGYLPPMSTHDFNLLAEEGGHSDKKYADVLHQPHGIDGYYDYEEGMEAAREMGKPVLVDFTGHGCVNCRKMEEYVWPEKQVLPYLLNDYVVISLYVDDKTIILPEEEWYYSKVNPGTLIKKLADKNADIQDCYFNENSQPQYALLDNQGELLQETRYYDLDVQAFAEWLQAGLNEYNSRMLMEGPEEAEPESTATATP
jgi:thiol:disulfide interchange protein